MISSGDIYHVLAAITPLYVAMILAYTSVKWWKLFSQDQCSGINKFVAKFSIPLLSFQVTASNNIYKMNVKLICADIIQKAVAISIFSVITKIKFKGSLSWTITGLSVSTMPNTLILGIPLLRAMYGDEAASILAQIVVMQNIVWYNLLLFLFELNAAKKTCAEPPSEATGELEAPQEAEPAEEEEGVTVSTKAKTMHILSVVGRKLIINPNTHATVLGMIWSCICFRWGVQLPDIVAKSISILLDGGLGMAMFSLGLFMASRTSIIPCGARMALLSMAVKFLAGPALMALSSTATRLRGIIFKVAIVQAALPQGIVPFVFAREYNIHPDILSTGVIFGLLIATPIALGYYLLLAL